MSNLTSQVRPVAAGSIDPTTSDQDQMYQKALQCLTETGEVSCNQFFTLIELEKRFGDPKVSILFDYPRTSWKREEGQPLALFVLHSENGEPEEICHVPVNNSWVGSGLWNPLNFDSDYDKDDDRQQNPHVMLGLQLCSTDPADYRLTMNSYDRTFNCSFLSGMLFTGDHARCLERLFDDYFIL